MKPELSPEFLKAISEIATVLGGSPEFHILQPRICDNCQDSDKEAFPYNVKDRDGKEWGDLCNDCFESLGCAYEGLDEATEEWAGDWFCDDCAKTFPTDGNGLCPYCDSENIVPVRWEE